MKETVAVSWAHGSTCARGERFNSATCFERGSTRRRKKIPFEEACIYIMIDVALFTSKNQSVRRVMLLPNVPCHSPSFNCPFAYFIQCLMALSAL
jgi:hypothetical protein